jgi:hypothetical protein
MSSTDGRATDCRTGLGLPVCRLLYYVVFGFGCFIFLNGFHRLVQRKKELYRTKGSFPWGLVQKRWPWYFGGRSDVQSEFGPRLVVDYGSERDIGGRSFGDREDSW